MSGKLEAHSKRRRAPECGKLNVRSKMCERCLLGKTPHLPYPANEVKARAAVSVQSHFTCHEYQNVMCRGFYERFGDDVHYIRVAKSIGAIAFVGGTHD